MVVARVGTPALTMVPLEIQHVAGSETGDLWGTAIEVIGYPWDAKHSITVVEYPKLR